MFQLQSWPNVILHLDGDSFFASVLQAVRPNLKGKPLVVGAERGLATAVSIEAKKLGIKRGMTIREIKKNYPQCLCCESDYEIYNLFSQKMFAILRSFSPTVEEYSVDEGFADLMGLQRPLHLNYQEIGRAVQQKIISSLGISVSIGISVTKSLAKLASSFKKPAGLVVVPGPGVEALLQQIPVLDVWGIGVNTNAYLNKLQIKTALQFCQQSEEFIKSHLSKPFWEIWRELRGEKVYDINTKLKQNYQGMAKTKTFNPATSNPRILWAKLLTNLEKVFVKARLFHYYVGKVSIFLKTQNFQYFATEVKLIEKTSYPLLIRSELKQAFGKIFKKNILYRATGCWISDFSEEKTNQQSLFFTNEQEQKAKKIYALYESKKVDFGATLFDRERLQEKRKPALTKLPFLNLNC